MLLGNNLRRLRAELAFLDHDLVLDGRKMLVYCARCYDGDLYPVQPCCLEALMAIARIHHTACSKRARLNPTDRTNDGP